MSSLSSISFEVIDLEPGGPKQMHPKIDASFLAELVETYEASVSYDPAGGYAGIVPDYFNCGDLRDYWLGKLSGLPFFDQSGEQALLGCDCGTAGCWPLLGHVEITEDEVTWSDFRQPHRPERSYDGFGPFRFTKNDYTQAIELALGKLSQAEGA
jgi:hypothetical protein